MTFFTKFIFSGIFLCAAVALLTICIAVPAITHQAMIWPAVFFSLVWSAIAISCSLLTTLPLKSVSVGSRSLYVSNFFRAITIPVIEIERIEEAEEFRFRLVVIHLKSHTVFGRKIKFLPKSGLWRHDHEIFEHLKELTIERDD